MTQNVLVKVFIKISSNIFWRFLCIDLWQCESEKLFKYYLKYTIFIVHILNTQIYGCLNATFLFSTPFDLEKVTFGISFVSTMLMVCAKYSCVFLNQHRLKAIIDKLPESYTKEVIADFKISARLSNMKKFMNIYTGYMLTSLIFLVLGPLSAYLTTGTKAFPFLTIFPFDATGTFAYPAAFVWTFFAHITHIMAMVGNDNILYGLVNVISIEFEILRENFDALKNLSDEAVIKSEMSTHIRRHNELHEIVWEMQRIFSPTFFINFIMSSFIICFNVFQASTSADIIGMIFNGLFSLSTMNQIFMQCYFGQSLRNSSSTVVDGIYFCGWENFKDLKLEKDLILTIQRAQKPAAFTIIGVWDISMDQFKSVRTF